MLEPISTEGITSSHEDITALVERTRNAMVEAIEELGRRRAETNRLKDIFKTGEEENDPLLSSPTTPST